MVDFKDIEIGDIIKIDTYAYNKYVGLAKVVKKGQWDGMTNKSLCIGITPLEECIQKEYRIKPIEIIEIENNDKYENIVFKFIKL